MRQIRQVLNKEDFICQIVIKVKNKLNFKMMINTSIYTIRNTDQF